MLKKKLSLPDSYDNYILRAFSAWCLSAVFFFVLGRSELSPDSVAQVSIFTFALIFVLNYALVTLVRLLQLLNA